MKARIDSFYGYVYLLIHVGDIDHSTIRMKLVYINITNEKNKTNNYRRRVAKTCDKHISFCIYIRNCPYNWSCSSTVTLSKSFQA